MIIQSLQALFSATQVASDSIDGLNHPLAVVAILAGCAIIIREVSWAVISVSKRIKGENPDALNSKLADALNSLNTNLTILNERSQNHIELEKDHHRSLCVHVDELKHTIERFNK